MKTGPKTILLVEDEAVVAILETQLLKREGYNVINAKNGELAISVLRSGNSKIDLILMDIDLGEGIDGTETAQAILNDFNIPIVFLSSHTEKEIVEKTENITSYGYVVKNTGITVLDASIKMAFKLFDAYNNISIQKREIVDFNENLQSAVEELEATNEELLRSEMLLMEKEELLQLTSRIAKVGGWEIDTGTLAGKWTEEVYRIHELEPGSPVNLEMALGFYTEDSKEKISKALDDAINLNRAYDHELEFISHAGNNKWVRAIGFPVKQGNRIVKVHGTFQDITERKHAEIEVSRLNRLYEVTSQINQLIVHARDRDNLLKNSCRITVETGKLQMAWIGFVDHGEKAVIPYTWSGVEDGYLTRIKKISISDVPEGRGPTGTAIREGRYFCCNDIERDPCMNVWRDEALKRGYRSSIAIPFFIEGVVSGSFNIYAPEPYFFTESEIRLLEEVTSDIAYALEMIETDTRRKKAEEQYRLIAENSSDIIWVLQPDGRLTYHSPSVMKLRGYTPEEANNIPLNETLTPESFAKVVRMIEEDRNKPVPLRVNEYRIELEMLRKDKSTVWTEVSVHVSRDAEGNVAGFQGSTRDITERKKTEYELGSLALQRETLIKELQHRVKNNLNVVSAMLALESERLSDEKAARSFDDAINRIQAMRIIYDRLYISGDLNKVELDKYIKDLADSICSAIAVNRGGVNLVTELDTVDVDLKRTVSIGLVLNELITNSLKYACRNGSATDIIINLVNSSGKVTLCVRDNGPGFPDGFNSANAGTMGLLIVKMLSEQIGADMFFENMNGASVSMVFAL